MDSVDYQKSFEFHYVNLKKNGKNQCLGDCPFCGKTGHFFVQNTTGKWDCKRCGESGNLYTFMTRLHQQYMENMSDSDFEIISGLRGEFLPPELLKKHGVCLDVSGNVVIPYRKPGAENLTNLKIWDINSKKSYNTPNCMSLYYVSWNNDNSGPIYVCEGEWDALALVHLFNASKQNSINHSIVAVPGANTFKESWSKVFDGREAILLYDNDHDKKMKNSDKTFNPAKDGMERAAGIITKNAKDKLHTSVSMIDWTRHAGYEKLSDGYDIRDYVMDAMKRKKPKGAFKQLHELLVSKAGVKKQSALKRTSFDEVVHDFKEVFEFNQSFVDTLACCFATMISLRIEGNPLWLFVVGPPSSGKTAIIEAFESCTEESEHISKLTPASLVSGWRGDGEDNSLLPKLRNRTLCIKDFTAVLNMGSGDKENLFGMLRDAYDGRFVQIYGTGLQRSYTNLYFSIIAGVTHAIHGENRTSLGERFLKINLLDNKFNEIEHIRKAINNVGLKPEQKGKLSSSVLGYIQYMKSKNTIPSFPVELENKLICLSQLVAVMRTNVQRGFGGYMSYRPEPEIGSRIATQLKKLAISLGIVFGKDEVDDDCYRIVKKVALDSCVSWQMEVVEAITKIGEGCTVEQISQQMQVHPNQVRKVVEDSMQIGVVELRKAEIKGRGNRSYLHYVSDPIAQLIRDADVRFNTERRNVYTNKTKRSKKLINRN
jgi:hypothetical protein